MKWTKIGKRHLKITGFLSFLLLSLLSLATVFHPFASATYLGDRTPEYGYFYNNYLGGRGWHDVIPGGIPNTADKGTFINFITDKYYNGSEQEKTGAAFIINLQLGNSGSGSNRGLAASDINGWAILIQQPQVSFSMENYGYSYNSAYDTPTDDDLFYAESGVRWSLVVRYNGVIVSVIKQDCANPLDGNSGIPKYTPQWSLSATATASQPTILARQSVNFNYNLHNNGPDPANFQYVTRLQEYINGVPQAVNSWPVPNAVEGSLPGGASEPSYSVRTYTSTLTPGLSKVCSWIEYAGQSSSNGAPGASNQACVTIQQPVSTCSTSTFAPTAVGMPTSFVVRIGFTPFVGPPLPVPNFNYTITGPSGTTTGTSPASWSAGVMQSASISFTPTTAGSYTLAWSYNGFSCGIPASIVGYAPYFSSKSGDISAGNGFNWGGSCTGNNSASIQSWNMNDTDSTNYGGGTAGLAAFVTATNGLQHFVSAGDMTGGAATNGGHGLSFANYSGSSYLSRPTYGTSIGAASVLPCVHDYQADAPAATRSPLAGTSITSATLNSLASGNYQATAADFTIGDGGTIVLTGGKKITIYVSGNAYIRDNIWYNYNQVSDISMFRLVVKGNIYVYSAVGEIHGVYVAQAKAASGALHAQGGVFYTCATAPSTPSTDYTTCSSRQLKVIGSVAAENGVTLGRTYGSLVADPTNSVPAEPAEIFRYSPELWLNPANAPANAPLTYQSYTGLPPVL